MKLAFTFLFLVSLNPIARADESPMQTLTKSAATASVTNGSSNLPLAQVLASAFQHEENEKLAITQNCEGTLENATTRLENCSVAITKSQAGQFNGVCGEFGKGTYFFRFVRANVAGNYRISGDIQLEISRR